jgi:hypothetical protein
MGSAASILRFYSQLGVVFREISGIGIHIDVVPVDISKDSCGPVDEFRMEIPASAGVP